MNARLKSPGMLWGIAHFVLLLWTAWIMAGLSAKYLEWRIFAYSDKSPIEPRFRAELGSIRETPPDYNIILSRNLFNSDQTTVEDLRSIGRKNIEDSPETRLPLKLVGTIVEASGEYLFAVILNTSDKSEEFYKLNDKVMDARIIKIIRNRVFIQLADKVESITLEDFTTKDLLSANGSLTEKGPVKPESVGNNVVLDANYVKEQLSNIGLLLTQLSISPNIDKATGFNNGFKLSYIKPGSLLSKAGLRSGDIIYKVNGAELNSPEKGLELFQALRYEKKFNIDIGRGSGNETIFVSLE